MNEDITRVVTAKASPLYLPGPDGIFSDVYEAQSGFRCMLVEKPWVDDIANESCIPRPARYPARCMWSNKHRRFLYHILDVPGRDAIELHSANVQWQLLGCGALGARIETFTKDSLGNGLPPFDARGVVASRATVDAFMAAMKNPVTGESDPFWLEI